MNVTAYFDPWVHYVIDDVLPEKDFLLIQSLSKDWVKPNTQKEKLNLRLDEFKYYEETIDYAEEAEKVLTILKNKMDELTDYFQLENKYKSYHIEYVNCGNDFYYHVHKDAITKIFTNVFYVSKNGDGTRLYKEKKGSPVKTIEWKENRILAFEPSPHTWHDYYSKHDDRITFNMVNVSFILPPGSRQKRHEFDLTPTELAKTMRAL